MDAIFLIELNEYKKEYLKLKLKDKYELFISDCFENRIIKNVNTPFKFEYVGIIMVDNFFVFILPKFIDSSLLISDTDTTSTAKLVLKTILKYNKEHKNKIANDQIYPNIEDISVIDESVFLIKNFLDYGLLETKQNIKMLNGFGEIDWDGTIDQIYPIYNNNRPMYIDLLTDDVYEEDSSYLKTIQKNVLNYCFELLESPILNLIYKFPRIRFEVSNLKLKEAINYLDKKIIITFNDYELSILKSLKSILVEMYHTQKDNKKTLFIGINKYYPIWEQMLQNIFQHDSSLLEKIPTAYWNFIEKEPLVNPGSLKPDILVLDDLNFYILDAKYYPDPTISLEHAPSINDITKQFLYEKLFNTESDQYKFYNAFLFPNTVTTYCTQLNCIINIGNITYKELFPNNIELIQLNPLYIMNYYLERQHIDIVSLISTRINL